MSFPIFSMLEQIKNAISGQTSYNTELANLQAELDGIKAAVAALPSYAAVLGSINTSLQNIAGIGAVADLDVSDLSATVAKINETLALGTLTVGGDIVVSDGAGGAVATMTGNELLFDRAGIYERVTSVTEYDTWYDIFDFGTSSPYQSLTLTVNILYENAGDDTKSDGALFFIRRRTGSPAITNVTGSGVIFCQVILSGGTYKLQTKQQLATSPSNARFSTAIMASRSVKETY